MEDSRPWTSRETKCFLALWSDAAVQSKLDSSYRNRPIFEDIAANMQAQGYSRTWLQCQRKIKHLKALYKKVKEGNDLGESGRTICPFYNELDKVLDDRVVSTMIRPVVVRDRDSAEDLRDMDAVVIPGPSVKTEGLDSVIKMEESPDDFDDDDNDIGSANPSTIEPRDCIDPGEDADEYADPCPLPTRAGDVSRGLHNTRHRGGRVRRSNIQRMESQLSSLGDRFLEESRREFEEMMSRDRAWLEEDRRQRGEERQEQHRIWQQEWRECQVAMTTLTPSPGRGHAPPATPPCGGLLSGQQGGFECTSPKPQSHVLQAVLLLMKELGSEELQVVCRTAQDRLGPVRTAQDRLGPVRTAQDQLGPVRTAQDRVQTHHGLQHGGVGLQSLPGQNPVLDRPPRTDLIQHLMDL